jgi:hypothetical protein
MPIITKKQRQKLLTYLSLLGSSQEKVKFLLECGYFWAYSEMAKDWCFVRIDSVNWKKKYSSYRNGYIHSNPDGTTPQEIYARYISRDFLMHKEDLNLEWDDWYTDDYDYTKPNYHVDLSFFN